MSSEPHVSHVALHLGPPRGADAAIGWGECSRARMFVERAIRDRVGELGASDRPAVQPVLRSYASRTGKAVVDVLVVSRGDERVTATQLQLAIGAAFASGSDDDDRLPTDRYGVRAHEDVVNLAPGRRKRTRADYREPARRAS